MYYNIHIYLSFIIRKYGKNDIVCNYGTMKKMI